MKKITGNISQVRVTHVKFYTKILKQSSKASFYQFPGNHIILASVAGNLTSFLT